MALPTQHQPCGFYLTWFFRLFEADDHGWKMKRTPDDESVGFQDAFFWGAMESIARTMNLMLSEERRRLAPQRGSGSG